VLQRFCKTLYQKKGGNSTSCPGKKLSVYYCCMAYKSVQSLQFTISPSRGYIIVTVFAIVAVTSTCRDIMCESIPGSPLRFNFLSERGESLGTRLPVCYTLKVSCDFIGETMTRFEHQQRQSIQCLGKTIYLLLPCSALKNINSNLRLVSATLGAQK